jgi:hypothetical protein
MKKTIAAALITLFSTILPIAFSILFMISWALPLPAIAFPVDFSKSQLFPRTTPLLATPLLATPLLAIGTLQRRVEKFPNWANKPTVKVTEAEIPFPEWIAGTWHVQSTLIDLLAPLAPKVVTPGFENNRALLNQAIEFEVRYNAVSSSGRSQPRWQFTSSLADLFATQPSPQQPSTAAIALSKQVIIDRAFNGLNIARAYLGDDIVESVTLNPKMPNEQITRLQGDRELTSLVTGRNWEAAEPEQFFTTELSQQVFRGMTAPFLNQVETTTRYQYHRDRIGQAGEITADQYTAIYLSPKDPDYFKAGGLPVALYRYQLQFERARNGQSPDSAT